MTTQRSFPSNLGRGWWLLLLIAPALIIFAVTWVSITQSRSDSLALLEAQGKSFTAALAQASETAISSESFYDRLVQLRYYDLTSTLAEVDLAKLSETDLLRFARTHDLFGVYLFGIDSNLIMGANARGITGELPPFVVEEVAQLIANPESRFALLLDVSDQTGDAVHYYLELTNQLDRIVVLVIDADYYVEAEEQIAIGYLAQEMAKEPGVEYIVYQSPEGIVFASRKMNSLLAIESDPFLMAVVEADTAASRLTDFQGKEILEIIQPFTSEEYPAGLFRIGISLDRYHSISRGFDTQMLLLSGFISVLLVLAVVYVNSREKRREMSRRYARIKSVTDQVFEQMNTGVAVVDEHGLIRMANQAFESILGVSNVTDRPLSEYLDPNLLKLDSIKAGRATAAEDVEIAIDRQGRTGHILVAVSGISYESSTRSDTLLVVYDITSLKKAEQAAARKERLSEMGNLAASVAHEIRNPLNTISIAAQRLATEFKPQNNSDDYLSFTNKIRSETSRLNDIITRFLALARAKSSRSEKIQLDRLVVDTAGLLSGEASTTNIQLSTTANELCSIAADPDELTQVLHNLVTNAREAIGGAGGHIAIQVKREGDLIVMEVSDDGPGVPENIRAEIFTPYFTTKEAGTGLGLPTVHRIVTGLGGDISVDQSEWGGALFRITLPAVK